MMIARKLVIGAFLAMVASAGFVGCAEDNEKAMMEASKNPPPGSLPPQGSAEAPPPGNDAEARKKYEMQKQADMYKNYPGYNSKGR
jgi:hypothetical protein